MQTYTRAVSIGYVVLAAAAVIAINLRIVLIPAGCAALALFVAGLLIFRRFHCAFTVPWPAAKADAKPQRVVVMEGTPLPFQGYSQELMVVIRVRHMLELLACIALCTVALYVMVFVPITWEDYTGLQIGVVQAEFVCGVGLAVLLACIRWFAERRALRRSRYAFGSIIGRDPGFVRSGITYQFFDHKGERRGGRGPLWGRGDDNAVLVLYDPSNPDVNVAHGALFFHRFHVALAPARNRRN